MTIEHEVTTIREALKIARREARDAREKNKYYTAVFRLENGRSLTVYHAPASHGTGPLLRYWNYVYNEQEARARVLRLKGD